MSAANTPLKVGEELTKLYRFALGRYGTQSACIQSHRRLLWLSYFIAKHGQNSHSFVAAKLFRPSRPVYMPGAASLLPQLLVRTRALCGTFIRKFDVKALE